MKRLLPLSVLVLALAARPALGASLDMLVNGQPYHGELSLPHVTLAATVPITITFRIRDGKAAAPPPLKYGHDVQLSGTGTNPQPSYDEYNFFVIPSRPGKVSFPAFDIKTTAGQALHVNAFALAIVPLK